MIRSLGTWPYLTAILAFVYNLFLHILDKMSFHGRLMLVFWTGFWCGSALTAVLLLIYLRILSGVGGVQSPRVDPNRRAASHSKERIRQTLQISGFQDVVVPNTLITALWLYIQKYLEDGIKNAVHGYVTDGSKHIGLRAVALLTFGKILDKVLHDFKTKVLHKLEYAVSGVTKRITLKEVDLGTKPPQITEIRYQDGLDECAVEIGLRWEPEGAGLKLSLGLWDIIQVKNMHLEATVKLVLKPLREEIPGFGAVLVSLKEAPTVDFDLDIGVWLVNDTLNPKKIIQDYVESALMNLIIWPRRFVFPTIPGEDFSFLESQPVGELKVILMKVEDIVYTHHIGKVDYFVEISVHQSKVERSTFKKSSKGSAFWNETFTVQVEDPETQKLTVQLWRRSRVSDRLRGELIGSGKFLIAQFHPGVEKEMRSGLRNRKTNEIHGKLFLAIMYHPYPMGDSPGLELV